MIFCFNYVPESNVFFRTLLSMTCFSGFFILSTQFTEEKLGKKQSRQMGLYQRQQLGLNLRSHYLPLLLLVRQLGVAVKHNDEILTNLMTSN